MSTARALPTTLRLPFLVAALSLSGACALVYQTAWLREFRLVFGGATPAAAAVLAIFMGGLGLGSALLGRRAERVGQPLKLYAAIELGVGVSAMLTPLFFAGIRRLYIATGGSAALGLVPATLLQLVLSALVLAVPCALMGGSLPAAFKWAETEDDAQRGRLGVLYGVNTLGAVAGVVFSTFWLLEAWGTRATVWAAALVNVALGLAAWAVARREPSASPAKPAAAHERKSTPKDEAPSAPRAPPRFIYAAAATTGFTFFLCELAWFRLLGPLLGSSVYGFGLVLALALTGIGLGGLWYRRRWAERVDAVSSASFATLAGWQAVALAAPWALGDRLAVFAIDVAQLRAYGLAGQVVGWTLVASVLVLVPSVLAGVQFPLLVALLGRGRRDAGRHVGLAYAANTAGAIAGSLAGGFVLLPALTAPGTWKLAVGLTLGLSLAAALVARATTRWWRLALLPAPWALSVALLSGLGPTAAWRHESIGYGRVESLPASANALEERLRASRRQLVTDFEGREASVGVLLGNNGYALMVNGKSDGTAFGDADTQVMLGLLPALLHPAPRSAFVVGLGTGSTAGWLAEVPGMERVDVVELEPGMGAVARDYFQPVNHGAMSNPKVHVAAGDAREALLVDGPQYDVIVSEPSNPYRAGVATLFTREYYQSVQARLAPGGVFAQWVQAYEVDARAIRLAYATLASVFPYVETWLTEPNDLVFIAHTRAPAWSLEQLRQRVGQRPFAEALERVWLTRGLEGVLAHHLAAPDFAKRFATPQAPVNTDDQNLLEFGFARALAEEATFDSSEVAQLSVGLGQDQPAHLAGQLDVEALREARLLMLVADGTPFQLTREPDETERQRRAAALSAYVDRRYDDVLDTWTGPAATPMEQLMLLTSAARAGTAEEVQAAAEPLEAAWPADVHFARAVAAARLGTTDPVPHLRDGFRALRSQVWVQASTVTEALRLVTDLPLAEPGRAELFFELLREPFPGGLAGNSRLQTLSVLAPKLPLHLQLEVVALLEPHPPWNRQYLEFRADVHRRANAPQLAADERDLAEFLSRTSSELLPPSP